MIKSYAIMDTTINDNKLILSYIWYITLIRYSMMYNDIFLDIIWYNTIQYLIIWYNIIFFQIFQNNNRLYCHMIIEVLIINIVQYFITTNDKNKWYFWFRIIKYNES